MVVAFTCFKHVSLNANYSVLNKIFALLKIKNKKCTVISCAYWCFFCEEQKQTKL